MDPGPDQLDPPARALAQEPSRADSGRSPRRFRWAWAAVGVLVLAVVAALAGMSWQVRRAEAQARRAEAVQDFLVDLFRDRDPRAARDTPHGEVTAKALLDRNAPRIPVEFADQPDTQIALLGVTASIYRALGDEEGWRRQQRLQADLIRAHYGDAHPAIVEALLEDARHAHERNDDAESLRILDHADALIRRADLDHSGLRARWWLLRRDATLTDPHEDGDRALENALALFEQSAPDDPAYLQALASQAARARSTDLARAESLYEKAIALAEKSPARSDVELARQTYLGLAGVREDLGEYDGARQAYGRLFELARHADGEGQAAANWVPTAEFAWMLHRFGERERANALFAHLLETIPAVWDANSDDEEARELYADRLVAEGRAVEAIPILEQARKVYLEKPGAEDDVRRNGLVLAMAYARADRFIQARPLLKATLDECVAKEGEDSAQAMAARVRWAEFLLSQDEIVEAQVQFRQVVAQAGNRRYESVALAHAGLARVALVFGDTDEALAQSRTGIEVFEHVTGTFDVRAGPAVWLAHAETLGARGERAGVRDWAGRALEASRRYDAPSARSIAQAEAAVHAADAP